MTKAQKAAQQDACEKLRKLIQPGDKVFTILDHVSKSGMTRHIRIKLISKDGTTYDPNYLVAQALDMRQAKRGDGIVTQGCGMDMGFSLVYNLGYALFPDGFTCTGLKTDKDGFKDYINSCPSNDHSTRKGDYSPHIHKDGGYALRHEWL